MIRLTILHTNDLHGRALQLARIATLAKEIRAEAEATQGYCVLWDAGDAEDTILLESSMTKGSAVMAMLRSAGYDQAALGNATPARYGPQAVQGLAEALKQPLLCANMIDPDTGHLVAGLAPYMIQTFGQVKVGIIGLTAPMSIYRAFLYLAPDFKSVQVVTVEGFQGRPNKGDFYPVSDARWIPSRLVLARFSIAGFPPTAVDKEGTYLIDPVAQRMVQITH